MNRDLIPDHRQVLKQLAIALPVALIAGFFGVPLQYIQEPTVTCQALSCPEPSPGGINSVKLAADILFWYIITFAGWNGYRTFKDG